MKRSEDEYCKALADHLTTSPIFVAWLLGLTKFQVEGQRIEVRWEEQLRKRQSPRAPWWRHWFTSKCMCVGCLGGRETDIFAVFENATTQVRFALHIEVKLEASKFTPDQALAYAARAMCWKQKERFCNYSEAQTVLVAPASFFRRHPDSALFDICLTFEDVGLLVPEFRH